MKTTSHLKLTIVPWVRGSIRCPPLRRVFLFVPLLLACLALLPIAQAVVPPPDGGYANGNTAEGTQALFSLTTGAQNTANGFQALYSNRSGAGHTAIGFQALYSNTSAGGDNNNTAVGFQALYSNTSGQGNNAFGGQALLSNISGTRNVAVGGAALSRLTSGDSNVAVGNVALAQAVTVNFNTALGRRALSRSQGDQNVGLGFFAGGNLSDVGTNNIYVGNVGPVPIGSESNTIRIGMQTATTVTVGNPPFETYPMPAHTATYIAGIAGAAVNGRPVMINGNGQLGTPPCSARYKDEIEPMDAASEVILALKPVTFRYKKEIDADRTPQFGLVAEQVEKVNPDLVSRDADGKAYTVRYDAVNAMLLNEFLKEHKTVQEQGATIGRLQKQIEALTETVQKVSAHIELTKVTCQT